MVRYFEDVEVGETIDCGSHTVTEEEILEFAGRYDPQAFHVDREAARESIFGGLVASGWHTAALCHRLTVDAVTDYAFAGAQRVDELRWRRPVRPGTTLSVDVEFARKDPDGGRQAVGHVDLETRGTDGDGELLVSMTALSLMHRREAGDDRS